MRFVFWLGLCFLSFSVFAQNESYNFNKLDTYSGLSNNHITAILKDDDGFIWFGTISGLNRYDGYTCKVFRNKLNNNSSVFSNSINDIYELPETKMWVQSGDGASIYNLRTESFETDSRDYLKSLGLPLDTVRNISKGNNGRYWFIYENLDLYMYSSTDKKIKPFKHNFNFNLSEKISSVKETKDGMLWIVYQNGLLQEYDIKNEKIIFSSNALQKFNITNELYHFIIDTDGDIWLWRFPNGVFLFHPQNNSVKQFTETSSPSKLSSNLVSQIVQDNNNLIWVATDHGGVTLIDKKNNFKTSYLLNDPKNTQSLSQNSIISMYKDNDGIIWLGTYKQGVNYYSGTHTVKFQYYHHNDSQSNSLQFDDVNCFIEDKTGNIWIGTNGGGLVYFNRKKNTFKQFLHDANNKNSISSNVIVSLSIDKNGLLWIGTFLGGLCCYDGNKFAHYQHKDNEITSLANDNIWALYEDKKQNLWVGTLGGGLDIFNTITKQSEHYQLKENSSNPVSLKYISAFLQDRQDNLWVGTTTGIIVLDKNRNVSASYSHTNRAGSLSDDNVLSFLEDSKGRIWVGTRGGLNLFDDQTKTFQLFTSSNGLPDDIISNILEDKKQTLWISTPKGLCNVISENIDKNIRISVINYDQMNGLQSIGFNDKAALKTKTGELIFGGPSGFNIINPEKIQKPIYHPKIVFTGLQILNNTVETGEVIDKRVLLPQSLSYLQNINLKYKENVFTIEFASTDFTHGENEKYAYMMEGFSTDWLYTTGNMRRATYTNLAPGHYSFKVKVLNRNGIWSDVKTLQINIQPPFWRTTVSYIIYLLLLGALLLLIRRITLDRIHMRYEVVQQKNEIERVHAMEQLKTKFFTNVSHEFRTPLSLIITPLDNIIQHSSNEEQRVQLNLVQRNAKRLLNLVNQLLDFRKMEVQAIKFHPSIGDIVNFCRDISYSFTDIAEKKKIQFSFSSNIDELEVYFDKDKIEKILFNLLSNAFKYTFDNGQVSINLIYNEPKENETDGKLTIEVKDNGIGIPADMHEMIFERFFQTDVPESMVNQGVGIGLAITKEFVKLHGGIISVKSEPDAGTCFQVLLPAKKIYISNAHLATKPFSSEDVYDIVLEENLKKDKKTILVVEDNEDLRFYLKENLKKLYHIEEAVNGKEGWEKVKSLNPDIVVSDIMMPVMDGIELAKIIKSEMQTSHIPIILLTAMGSEEKQIEGYNIGVNDYITKPFIFDILVSRIRNLIAQQKLLQKKFHKQIEVNPAEVTITPVDEKFLKDALGIVERHLDEPGFSVEEFSREIFMNRVTLYRKILSLTGKTPIEFIRSIRLKRAAQLLEKSGKSIAEIAYEVGFNNPKVFSKFFKEEFDLLPSQYNKKGKTE